MTGNVTAELLALFVAGLIAPYLTQLLKILFGNTEGTRALWLSFGVAILISAVALLLTGEMGWVTPPTEPTLAFAWFAKYVGVVYALSTLVYKNLISRPG